jgi:hypothetical protein
MSSRRLAWVVAGVCGIATIGLIAVVVFMDLDTGDQVASVVGASAGLVGCALSVYFGVRQAGAGGPGVQARGRATVAAGGNATGNAVGKGSKVTRSSGLASVSSSTPPAPSQHGVIARGTQAVAGGGHVTDNAIGEGSEVDER